MIGQDIHIQIPTAHFDPHSCVKGTWLVLLHARRVPPHVGLMIDGQYNSLTVKGHELNVGLDAVHKILQQKKIEALFIRVAEHPVFSADYRLAVLHEMLKAHGSVKQGGSTCLSPIKDFFQEFYAVGVQRDELLFDFIQRLQQNKYLEQAMAMNMALDENVFQLPYYTAEELHERIKKERQPYYND